jgi:site-specific DNA-cytosine methylase
MKHATIVPLIGGETLGSEKAFGSRPEWLASYKPFTSNDKHLINYYKNEVPYHLIDDGEYPKTKVDVISTVCPCAGLSQLSHGFGDHNQNNKWIIETAKYVLRDLKPEVFWGENAPGFAGKIGENIRNQVRQIGLENGYSMTVYRTRSILHGVAQIRERAFYFFWRGNKVPILNYFNKTRPTIENTITGVTSNFQMEPINPKTPSKDDPYYRFILENIHNGITHQEFCKMIEPAKARGQDVLSYIERMGIEYDEVAEWMNKNNYLKEVDKCKKRKIKLDAGGNIMRRGTIVPRDYIGAFVGHYPMMLTHPIEDRYITYREALTIMGMPNDFELLNPKKNVNHICQNVPVQTATDMATEVIGYLNGEREMIDSTYTFQYNFDRRIETPGSIHTTLEGFF